MFANTQEAGIDSASPDVCLTPMGAVVPIAYTDIAQGPNAVAFVPNVFISAAPAHNLGTIVPFTSGDDPGVATGVSSGTVMGQSIHTTAAFHILIGGMPATRLTSQTSQNTGNISGSRVAPSQTKVVLLGA
jgi:Domain of unknown function (DUF4150)